MRLAFTGKLTVIFFLFCCISTFWLSKWNPTYLRDGSKYIQDYFPFMNIEKRKGGLFCAIMTIPASHGPKAKAVRDTWAKRCDMAVFFTSAGAPNVLINSTMVLLNVTEGRKYLWVKTRTTFLHIYQYYTNQFDWFLKADDDTYVIIDNLRSYLSDHNPKEKLMFGCELVIPKTTKHFPSGGAGYVLSRAAVHEFGTIVHSVSSHGQSFAPECGVYEDLMGEDVHLTSCLQQIGVKLVDTKDENGAFRLLPTKLDSFVFPEKNDFNSWVWDYGKPKQGINQCCHKNLISMHHVPPKLMYTYEFLIYHFELTQVM